MNSFGHTFRLTLFGESHGPGIGIVIDGCPAGLPIDGDHFQTDLNRRRPWQHGDSTRAEADLPDILSGVFEGKTTGAPLTLFFGNLDVDSGPYAEVHHRPRPGHADFTARVKYGSFNDFRGGGMFSGRMTVALVAAGVIAKKLIAPTTVHARLAEAGGEKDVDAAIEASRLQRDSIGGIVECRATAVMAGLGEPFFDSLESVLSHALFSIPGLRGIEFGAGFAIAAMRGSQANDPILSSDGRTASNHAGGINGGISNGNDISFRLAFRPTPSIAMAQRTVDLITDQPVERVSRGRHDTCFARRTPVIVEALTAIVLADAMIAAQKIERVLPQ